MRPGFLMTASLVGLLVSVPQAAQLSAQEAAADDQRDASAEVAIQRDGPIERVAIPRTSRSAPPANQAVEATSAQREPRGDRGGSSQGGEREREGQVERRAVPRASPPAPRTPQRGRVERRGPAIVSPRIDPGPRIVYRNYPYRYSGRYLPSRPGVFGYGYLYYGPRLGGYYPYDRHYYSSPYYSAPYYGGYTGYGYDIGELRLQVAPRHAKVFVDDGYAGTVDDFDGTFQAIKLESGTYTIRLEADGYETIEFNVRITPGQKVTYREDLRRR